MFSDTSQSRSRQLPKCLCHKQDTMDCLEMNDKVRAEYRQMDIEDVTDSVMKVMRICGLKPWEVKLAAGVIRKSFTHFEEVMHRIDRVPRKRFGKESFLHGLAHEAQMSRMDAQMAYAIVKRAFKAFYYGTGAEGRRYVCLQKNLFHGEECLWLHAARRTAEIHAVLAGMMHSEQRLFEERIECVYKSLVDVLKTRIMWENDLVCTCGQPADTRARAPWQVLSQADSIYSAEVEVLYHKENMGASTAASKTSTRVPTAAQSRALSSASSRHNHSLKKGNQTLSNRQTPLDSSAVSSLDQPRCNCAKLRCWRDGGEARESPEITAECSQGPYICRWLPYEGEGEGEQFPEHRVPYPPMEDVCPPCPSDDLPCDPECTCTCDVCTCRPHYDDGGEHEEEHLGEQLSKSGLEDHDTDFCWVAPFRGSSRERMAQQREQDEDQEVAVEEEGEFQCRCTCEVKQQAYPHLFTYLMPFREKKPVTRDETQPDLEPGENEGENEVGEEERGKTETESEDLLSKPPPWGISLATYRCWVKPPAPNSESTESDRQPKPPLVVVLGDKPKAEITVKKQHAEVQGEPPAPTAAAPLPKAPALPNKPAPTPAPSKPPLAPQKPEEKEKEDKLTKEEILDIIGLRFRPKK